MAFYPTEPNPRDARDILLMLRELYSRRPETRDLEAWELQHMVWSLRYTDELLDECEIQAAMQIARTDYDPGQGAA